jgi:hypothetical protein
MAKIDVYLELGSKRVFAGALRWPGWARSGRGEDAALEALAAYGARYAEALGQAAGELEPPTGPEDLNVVERLQGMSTTDFGAPAVAPAADNEPLEGGELDRQVAILQASWAKLDDTARKHSSATLRKGPRGGGRELDAIVAHVFEADRAYLARLGGRFRPDPDQGPAASEALRRALVDALGSRARGERPARVPRSGKLWSPRYFVRRSAWHALDHAWEIEDRAPPES